MMDVVQTDLREGGPNKKRPNRTIQELKIEQCRKHQQTARLTTRKTAIQGVPLVKRYSISVSGTWSPKGVGQTKKQRNGGAMDERATLG